MNPTDEERKLIFSGNYTSGQLSKLTGNSSREIFKFCKENGFKLPFHIAEGVNHDFFKIITNESAYIAGFIAADGCVLDKGGIAIELKSSDLGHLEKIRNLIAPGKEISHRTVNTGQKAVGLRFRSPKIASDLLKYNITMRKSLTLKWPEMLPQEFVSHFARGYFDGDGTVHLSKTWNKLDVSFVGTYDFLHGLDQSCPIFSSSLKRRVDKSYHRLIYTSKAKAKAILEWMYKDSNESIRLDRKYEIYINNIHCNEYIVPAKADKLIFK